MNQSRNRAQVSLPLRSKPDPFILPSMAEFKYRGRMVSSADILYIREMIATHPEASRRTLSKKLCEAWGWRQPNGRLSDMVCRGLLVRSGVEPDALDLGLIPLSGSLSPPVL